MRAHATEFLRHNHRTLKALFEAFEESEDTSEQKEALENVLQEITIHERLESEIFYPALLNASPASHLIDQAEEEHLELAAIMEDLRDMDPADPLFADKFIELDDKISQHVLTSETELFPLAEESSLDLESLGADLQEFRARLLEETASTRTEPPPKRKRAPRPR